MSHDAATEPGALPLRQAVMAVCAESTPNELDQVLAVLPLPSDIRDLRPPSTGLAMLRGRMGGTGQPFNLGEATVTRAAIALADGQTGFAYHLGRDLRKARAAAIIDALWQGPARARVEAALQPIRQRIDADRTQQAERTAATRVNFFTMVRGED